MYMCTTHVTDVSEPECVYVHHTRDRCLRDHKRMLISLEWTMDHSFLSTCRESYDSEENCHDGDW